MKNLLFIFPIAFAFSSQNMIPNNEDTEILNTPEIQEKILDGMREKQLFLRNVRDKNTYTCNAEQIDEYKEFFKSEIQSNTDYINKNLERMLRSLEKYFKNHLDDDLMDAEISANPDIFCTFYVLKLPCIEMKVINHALENLENPKPRRYKNDFAIRDHSGKAVGMNIELVLDITTIEEFERFHSNLDELTDIEIEKFYDQIKDKF